MLKKILYFFIIIILMLPVFGCKAKNAMEEYFNKIPTVKEINANTLFYLNIVPQNQAEKLILNNYNGLSLAVINEVDLYSKEFNDFLKLEDKYSKILTDIFLKWKHNKEKSLLLYDREEELFNSFIKVKSAEIFLGNLLKTWQNCFKHSKKSNKGIYFGIFSEFKLMYLSLLVERNKISYYKSVNLYPKSLVIHSLEVTDKDLNKELKDLYRDERKLVLEIMPRLRILKKRLDKILFGIMCLREIRDEILKENIISLKIEIKSYENKLNMCKKHKLLSINEIEINELYMEMYKIYLLSLENVHRKMNNDQKWKKVFFEDSKTIGKALFSWVEPVYAESYLERLFNIKEKYFSRPSAFILPKLKFKWIEKNLNNVDIKNKNECIKDIEQKINLFINHKEDNLSFYKNSFIDYRKAWFGRGIGLGTIKDAEYAKRLDDNNENKNIGLKINAEWNSSLFSQTLIQNISIYNKILKDFINKPSKESRGALKKAFLYSYLINLSFLSSPENTGGGLLFYNIGSQIKEVLKAKEDLIVSLYKKNIIHTDNLVDYIELMHGEGYRDIKKYQKLMNKPKQQYLCGKLIYNIIKRLKVNLLNYIIKNSSKSLREDAFFLVKEYKTDPKFDNKLFIGNSKKVTEYNSISAFNCMDLLLFSKEKGIHKPLKKAVK